MKKFFLAFAILTCIGLSLGAAPNIVLDFPSWQAEEAGFKDFWKEVITKFQAENPGVTVKLTQIAFKDYIDGLTTRFAAGNPPDVLHLPARNAAQFAAQDWLEPLDDLLTKTDILQNWTPLQSSMQFEGKNLGLLLMGYANVLYYNEKMFKDANVAIPRNIDELVAAAKKLTDEKKGQFGYGLTSTDHPNVYSDASVFVYGLGHSFFKNGKYNFTDPAVVKDIDYFRELAKYAPRGVTTELKRQLFIDGKIAMTVDGPWVATMIPKANAAIQPHLKIMTWPLPNITGNPSNGIHIPAGLPADRKALVWKFIQLMASPEMQTRYTVLTQSPSGRNNSLTGDLAKQYPGLASVIESTGKAVNTLPASPNVLANYALYSKLAGNGLLQLLLTNDPTLKVMEDMTAKILKEVKP
jgi:multiple sugar transport system substrate-binding protein